MEKAVSSEFIDDILVAQILVPQMRDLPVVEQVKSQLIQAINERTPRAIILDLGRIEFIGSVGFLAFLAARRASNVEQIIICNLNDRIHEVFAICRLIPHDSKHDTPFAVQPNLQQALAALNTSKA